ncbi:MAG TPA: histidine kinase [Rudaea sp.]|nr:histidine kinase [Rudaea sp.]
MSRTRSFAPWLSALLLFCGHAVAQRSYFALYDQDTGLNVGEIAALAQDDTGFLWIGAHRGLIRFDGHSFVPWAPETLDEVVYQLLYGPNDELLVRAASGRGWRRTAHGLEPLPGPDGKQLATLNSIAFDTRGRLWAVIGTSLWRRDTNERWSPIASAIPADEKIQRVYPARDGVVALTDSGAWRIGDDNAQNILHERDLWFAAQAADGALWIAAHTTPGLWRIDDHGARALARVAGRALDLRARGDTMWLSLDRTLVAYENGGVIRAMGIADGLPSGGPLLVDRENSLWLGTFVGLVQFPEPGTWRWGETEGLPSEHTYSIVARGGDVFVSSWSGLAHLDRDEKKFTLDFPPYGGTVCNDARSGLWTSDGAHLMHWNENHFDTVANWTSKRIINACVRDDAGVLWLATSRGLSKLDDGSQLHDTDIDGGVDQVWTNAGILYAAAGARVCRIVVANEAIGLDACVPFPTKARANRVAPISPKETWLSANDGIFGFDGHEVSRLPGNHLSEGGVAASLSPSSNGDWWMSGSGILFRAHPCDDCAAKWQVREAPGRWQGLPGNSAIDVSEDATGALWIAGNRGVWRVPKQARAMPQNIPRVVPVRVAVDGVVQSTDGALRIAPSAHRIELEFAALSYRDRSLLRFRSRLNDDDAWSTPTRSPVLQFADLEAGDYHAEMSASLDGEHWSSAPASVAFGVLPPWYRTIWAMGIFVVAAIALAAWLYRLRVAALLRVERERTRIAMDLHDELGSGLGSIGMLAGVAARDDVDDAEARQLAREIADLSGLLGSGLRSLVWSLRSGRAGIDELGSQIADHARRMFPGDVPHLAVHLPSKQSTAPLAPELRRHVLLFALEALHNVARHAHARHVLLTLESVGGDGLHLAIEDDGGGFDPTESARGTGLESMHRRAAAIAATMRVDSARGQGTRIALERPQTA